MFLIEMNSHIVAVFPRKIENMNDRINGRAKSTVSLKNSCGHGKQNFTMDLWARETKISRFDFIGFLNFS